MKILSAEKCPKKLENKVKRLEDEMIFIQQFLKNFETIRPHKRLPRGEDKERLINFLSQDFGIPLGRKLKIISLGKSRFYQWKNEGSKCLDDKRSCPRNRPTQLSFKEIQDIRFLLSTDKFNHMSISSLYWVGRRTGKVRCSISTWFKYIKLYKMLENLPPRKWYRPHKRGIAATAPNQIWHLDTTILKLTDRTRVYIHVIIDNYSRFIIAWKVSMKNSADNIKHLIEVALKNYRLTKKCRLITDAGTENINKLVERCLVPTEIIHQIAQVDIDYSNSMVEAFFRGLKQYSLYKKIFNQIDEVKEVIDHYLEKYNELIPRHGLLGLTPSEKYQNKISSSDLFNSKSEYRQERIINNLNSCLANCEK